MSFIFCGRVTSEVNLLLKVLKLIAKIILLVNL